MYAFLASSMRVTCPAHLILIDLIILYKKRAVIKYGLFLSSCRGNL
jgi:hypothetical protein